MTKTGISRLRREIREMRKDIALKDIQLGSLANTLEEVGIELAEEKLRLRITNWQIEHKKLWSERNG